MFGHLIPCRGGKPIAIRSRRLRLGRKKKQDATGASGSEKSPVELRLDEGHWTLQVHDPGLKVELNGKPVITSPVSHGDTLSLGKARYRVELTEAAASDSPGPKTDAADDSSRGSVLSLFGFGKRKKGTAVDGPPVLGVLIPCAGGKASPLRKERITVGREESCDVTIDLPTISRLHCGLEYVDGFWRVVDLGSRHGIMVNDVPYKQKWILPEDILKISVKRYRVEYHCEGRPSDDDNIQAADKSLTDLVGLDEAETRRLADKHERAERGLTGKQDLDSD